MAEIPPDNEIAGSIRSLIEKQRMVFNVVHKWLRNFIKRLSTKTCFVVDPIRIFLSGSGVQESLIKNYLPGCFKRITLSCQGSRETLCLSVRPNRHSCRKYRWNNNSFRSWNKARSKIAWFVT